MEGEGNLIAKAWHRVCSQPVSFPCSRPGKARLPHAAGRGVQRSLPSACHVLGGIVVPRAQYGCGLRRDTSPPCVHIPPAPGDSQGESQEVTARDRQKYICTREIKKEDMQ